MALKRLFTDLSCTFQDAARQRATLHAHAEQSDCGGHVETQETTMKRPIAIPPSLFLSAVSASDALSAVGAVAQSEVPVHRYLIERTFPPGRT